MTLDCHSFTYQRVIDCPLIQTQCWMPSSSDRHREFYPRSRLAESLALFITRAESRSPLFISNEIFNPSDTESVGQSILFEGNVLTNKRGNLPPHPLALSLLDRERWKLNRIARTWSRLAGVAVPRHGRSADYIPGSSTNLFHEGRRSTKQ